MSGNDKISDLQCAMQLQAAGPSVLVPRAMGNFPRNWGRAWTSWDHGADTRVGVQFFCCFFCAWCNEQAEGGRWDIRCHLHDMHGSEHGQSNNGYFQVRRITMFRQILAFDKGSSLETTRCRDSPNMKKRVTGMNAGTH